MDWSLRCFHSALGAVLWIWIGSFPFANGIGQLSKYFGSSLWAVQVIWCVLPSVHYFVSLVGATCSNENDLSVLTSGHAWDVCPEGSFDSMQPLESLLGWAHNMQDSKHWIFLCSYIFCQVEPITPYQPLIQRQGSLAWLLLCRCSITTSVSETLIQRSFPV